MSEQNKPKRNKWNPTGLTEFKTELRVESEKNKPKLYRPKDIRTIIPPIVFIICIITCFSFIFTAYWQIPLKAYIFVSLFAVYSIYFLSKLFYYSYTNCLYVETTEEDISGKNMYKMKRGIIKFNEIKEIWITKGYIILYIKDIHGKIIGISFGEEMVHLLWEILEKSENCIRIDCKYDYVMKHMKYKQLPEIKPLLDKRLVEIKEKENELRNSSNGTVV